LSTKDQTRRHHGIASGEFGSHLSTNGSTLCLAGLQLRGKAPLEAPLY